MANPPRPRWDEVASLLDLTPGETYTFSLVGSDPGGVARTTLRLPNGLIIIHIDQQGVIDETGTEVRSLTIEGSRTDPRKTLVLSGAFRIPPAFADTLSFEAVSSDFGGQAGEAPNERTMQVQASVAAVSNLH